MSESELTRQFDRHDKEAIASSGIDFSLRSRSGSFVQQDSRMLFAKSLYDGVDIVSSELARQKFPEFADYWGKLFRMNGKDYPHDTQGGYFIRVRKGKNITLPLQACLYLKSKKFQQRVHNVVVVEEGARVHVITGCASSREADEGNHLGVSEFFVQKNGYLNFTMIHSWKKDITVRPMSIALIEEGGTFISNYVCLRPVKDITMYPTAILQGGGARASFNSLILSHPGTLQDIGSRVIFKAPHTQAEVVSRAVSLGGVVVARGHILAQCPQVKAHLECRGLIISPQGTIHAIPELQTDYRDVDLSHEAAIGKISKEEIEYLCSRGFTQQAAQSIIVRGFMDVDILALPELLRAEINSLEEKMLGNNL